MLENITLEFNVSDKGPYFLVYVIVPELNIGLNINKGEPQIYEINNDELAKIASDYFEITEVRNRGWYGGFGRDVIDKENGVIIAAYSHGSSWSDKTYKNLFLNNFLGLFYKKSDEKMHEVFKEISIEQEKFATTFKKLIKVLREYDRAKTDFENSKTKISDVQNKKYKI